MAGGDQDEEREAEHTEEWFGEEPPKEEQPLPKLSPVWSVIRAIAIVMSLAYIAAVFGAPLYARVAPVLFGSGTRSASSCDFSTFYLCGNPQLSGGEISFTFTQDTGAALSNVTLYAVPQSADFGSGNKSLFPDSKTIPRIFSGDVVGVTISGGVSEYAIPTSGNYTVGIWISYNSTWGRGLQDIGTMQLTSA